MNRIRVSKKVEESKEYKYLLENASEGLLASIEGNSSYAEVEGIECIIGRRIDIYFIKNSIGVEIYRSYKIRGRFSYTLLDDKEIITMYKMICGVTNG